MGVILSTVDQVEGVVEEIATVGADLRTVAVDAEVETMNTIATTDETVAIIIMEGAVGREATVVAETGSVGEIVKVRTVLERGRVTDLEIDQEIGPEIDREIGPGISRETDLGIDQEKGRETDPSHATDPGKGPAGKVEVVTVAEVVVLVGVGSAARRGGLLGNGVGVAVLATLEVLDGRGKRLLHLQLKIVPMRSKPA